jgi:hypothetical protein
MSPQVLDDERNYGAEYGGADEYPNQTNLAVKKWAKPHIYRRLSMIVPDHGNQPDQKNRADDEPRSFDERRHRPLPSILRMLQAWRRESIVSTQRCAFTILLR